MCRCVLVVQADMVQSGLKRSEYSCVISSFHHQGSLWIHRIDLWSFKISVVLIEAKLENLGHLFTGISWCVKYYYIGFWFHPVVKDGFCTVCQTCICNYFMVKRCTTAIPNRGLVKNWWRTDMLIVITMVFSLSLQSTYDYGRQLLQATVVLCQSLRCTTRSSGDTLPRLNRVWKQFSVSSEERQQRLELALEFHTAAENVRVVSCTTISSTLSLPLLQFHCCFRCYNRSV